MTVGEEAYFCNFLALHTLKGEWSLQLIQNTLFHTVFLLLLALKTIKEMGSYGYSNLF